MTYSIVVPVYNSAKTLDELYNRVKAVFENVIHEDFEFVLVDDASKDDSLKVIKRLAGMDGRVRYVHLARNHGQQKAVLCGIDHASGDFIITMDDDLQHPPEEIPKLIEKMDSDPDIDVVIGKYDSKKHNGIRRLGTKMLDVFSDMALKKDKDLKLTSFRLMRKFVADNLSEININSPTVGHCLLMVDGNIENVKVRHDPRKEGKSGYSLGRLIHIFMLHVYENSDLPLRLVGYIGSFSLIFAMMMSLYYLVRYFSGRIHVSGWTTLVILVLFFNGLSLFSVGVMGRYLMINIKETKHLPKYSIKETNAEKKRGAR